MRRRNKFFPGDKSRRQFPASLSFLPRRKRKRRRGGLRMRRRLRPLGRVRPPSHCNQDGRRAVDIGLSDKSARFVTAATTAATTTHKKSATDCDCACVRAAYHAQDRRRRCRPPRLPHLATRSLCVAAAAAPTQKWPRDSANDPTNEGSSGASFSAKARGFQNTPLENFPTVAPPSSLIRTLPGARTKMEQ